MALTSLKEEGAGKALSSMSTIALKPMKAGSVESDSTQEHRILSTASMSLSNSLLFVLCDSRGYVYPLTIIMPTVTGDACSQAVQVHTPLRPFSTPVLSCFLCGVLGDEGHNSTVISAFGSSSGQVALWALTLTPTCIMSRLLLELPMHSMGANGVAMSLDKLPETEQVGSTPIAQWSVTVVSVGDDQAACVALVHLGIAESWEDSSSYSESLVVLESNFVRVESVGGAALRGICLWRGSFTQEVTSITWIVQ